MRNHHEKTRDMARSLLASKLGVKERRRQLHHRERSRVRAVLHRACIADPDDLDDVSDDSADADYTKLRLPEMVHDRRGAVSVGPLLRWAEHHLDHDPDLDNTSSTDYVEYLTSRLPYGVIGRQAVTRIAKIVDRSVNKRWIVDDATVGVRNAARWVMASGLHTELNRHLRKSLGASHPASSWKPDELRPTRFLGGWHDIDDFAAYDSNVRRFKNRNGIPSDCYISASAEGLLTTSFAEQRGHKDLHE